MSDGQDAINGKDYGHLEAPAVSVALRRNFALNSHIRVSQYFRWYCAVATTASIEQGEIACKNFMLNGRAYTKFMASTQAIGAGWLQRGFPT